MNQCTLCYDNIPLIFGTCSSCQQKDDLTFLLIPKGCVVQCPDGYSYDKDKVCYQNQKLITYSNSQLTKIKEDYQISGRLEQSAILLRLTLKLQLIGKNKFVGLKINGKYVAYINRFYIYSKLKYDYLQKMQNQIILEFNYPINSEQFIIQIVANQQKQNFQAPEVKIQYLVCALNCQKCKNNNFCEICKPHYYLYQGECFNNCPVYTTLSDQTCVDCDEKINYDENQEVIILVKEFFDLSTSQERINELFNVVVNSVDNQYNYNFQKGDGIYFSYFGNKRIFGGPFVWVNAKFQFHLNLQNIQQIVYVKFEVILGDEQMSRVKFHYQINSEVQKSLQIEENKQLHYDQNWQDTYFIDVIQVREYIQYEDDHENKLEILFNCDNVFENANTTFCGIQNLIISFQTLKQDQSDSSDQDYISDEDMENIFEISICGDGKVSSDEECDDGNLIPFDGCFNCEYSCKQLCQFCVKGECLLMFEQQQQSQIFQNTFIISQELNENKFTCIMMDCEVCIQGICLQCKIGYYMNYINNQCESKCGDLIIQGLEQCDDGNLDDYDGCSDCQLIEYENCIMLQTCAVCHYDKCLKCNDGYTLENNICISICGDALINKLEEQCDNPNEIGCINCQIEKGYICQGQSYSICKTCSNYCIDCQTINQQNLICKDCIIGYYPVQDNCLECDKNCITCKIQSNLCTSCYRSDCEICESIPGYYTDFQIKRCVTLCGDGILAIEQEECDDGNVENDDGCDSQCKIEIPQNYINDLLVWQFTGNTTYDFQLKNSEYQLQLNCQNPFIIIDGISTNDYSFNITLINKIFKSLIQSKQITQ
ncbi:unnamed protein product [Paramecium pentaurelia]|uniref:Insulin-like growth factor binding protein, N-terminal n=1 Tax=Paramecium pentaurelia TaxID=43138 RepID=A0A8S1X8J4_9CILI|nr:unnamed protein product [Paramecium pentaurelia]